MTTLGGKHRTRKERNNVCKMQDRDKRKRNGSNCR